MELSLCFCLAFFPLASCSVTFDYIKDILSPLGTFNFVLTLQTAKNPYVERVHSKFIATFLWRYPVPITVYTDPVKIVRPSPIQHQPSRFVRVTIMEQPWHAVRNSNPLSLSDDQLGQYNKNVGVYNDIFVIFAVKTPFSSSQWTHSYGGFCVTPSNFHVVQVSADAAYIEKITQFEPTGGERSWNLESKETWTVQDVHSRIHRSNQKNFQGFPVVIGYLMSYPDAYTNARSMSASDIVHEAYPWQVLLKVAEPLIDHFNLTIVVNAQSFLADTCGPYGGIFGEVSTPELSSVLHHQFVIVDVDQTAVLFRDRTAEESRPKLYDLTIPFQKQAWCLCVATIVIATFFFKIIYRKSFLAASSAVIAPLLLLSYELKSLRSTKPYIIWVIGCILIANFYLCKFSSNAVAPLITTTSKSISDLSAEKYSVIGTALFEVRDFYQSQYESMLETIDIHHVGNERLVQSYKDLLHIFENNVYDYEEQFNITMTSKTGLFGELFNLNVFRGAVSPKDRRGIVFAKELFFPNLKNNIFQLHHADIIAHGLQLLVDVGIYSLADRLGWHRALKNLHNDIEDEIFALSLQSPLVHSVIYCVLFGYVIAVMVFLGEQLLRINIGPKFASEATAVYNL